MPETPTPRASARAREPLDRLITKYARKAEQWDNMVKHNGAADHYAVECAVEFETIAKGLNLLRESQSRAQTTEARMANDDAAFLRGIQASDLYGGETAHNAAVLARLHAIADSLSSERAAIAREGEADTGWSRDEWRQMAQELARHLGGLTGTDPLAVVAHTAERIGLPAPRAAREVSR